LISSSSVFNFNTVLTKKKLNEVNKMTKKKWFHPKRETGWKEESSARIRRANVYGHTVNEASGRYGRLLLAEQQMFALSNVTTDPGTKMKAESDAKYFKRKREKMKKRISRHIASS